MMSVYLRKEVKKKEVTRNWKKETAYEERPRQVQRREARTKQEARPSNEGQSTKGMTKKSTTPATIQPEVWIAFGLLSSLVQQIVAVSLRIRLQIKIKH